MSNSLDRRIYSFFKKGVFEDPLTLSAVRSLTIVGPLALTGALSLIGASTLAGTLTLGGKAVISPVGTLGVDNIAGVGIYSQNDATSFFQNTGNNKRSYLLRVQAYRPATLPMGNGVNGVDDAAIFGLYRSYAADAAYCQQRGLNVSVNHRGTTGGSIGNCMGTNASTSTALAGDCITLSLNNECYALSVAGLSGVLDLMHTHEGANAGGGEFILRLRNAKKNGSALGAFILFDTSLATTALSYGIDMNGASIGTAEIRLANGMVIKSVNTAVVDNDVTTLPASSIVVTSHNTGKGLLFVSDGSNLQQLALA